MPNFYESLEFDLPGALTERLIQLFDSMPQGILDAQTIGKFVEADAQGVYQLFVDGKLVYIGKTDADAGLGRRLSRHAAKIAARNNLKASSVTFKAVRVFVFTVMDLEELLIKHYARTSGKTALPWNHSGFGSNDPGRRRDKSEVKASHFDALYPINLDQEITVSRAGTASSVADILGELKRDLPYLLRYQGGGAGKKASHIDLQNTKVKISKRTDTVRNVLKQIAAALGTKWQITPLPGYIILYKERVKYKHAIKL